MEDELTELSVETEKVIEDTSAETAYIGEIITPDDSVVPIYLVPLTPEEQTEREQWAIQQADLEQAETDRLAARESGLAKLAKLGLTEDEIKAITN